MSLVTTKYIVKTILENNAAARDSDRVLIMDFYNELGIAPFTPLYQVINNNQLPSFETITRCRRKVQAENPELRASKRIEKLRFDEQMNFVNFAHD